MEKKSKRNFMKIYLVLGSWLFSYVASADLEHIRGQGQSPSGQKLSLSRGCFEQMENKGCGSPGKDHAFFIACLDDETDKITNDCQSFFERLYGKRK
jgi:hypothetical protein